MRKWNSPKVDELCIAETANGLFCSYYESCLVYHNDTPGREETPAEADPEQES